MQVNNVVQANSLFHAAKNQRSEKIEPKLQVDTASVSGQDTSSAAEVSLSADALAQSQGKQQDLADQAYYNYLQDLLSSSKDQIEGSQKSMDALSRCMTIARRIANGDQVPYKDIKFLMDNNPDLFQMAMSTRMPKRNPEKYKSVLEDEEEDVTARDESEVVLNEPAMEESLESAGANGSPDVTN